MTVYKFINPEDIPDNLSTSKEYTTTVVSANWVDGDLVIELKYIGEEFNSENPQCLFPISPKTES